MENSGSITKRLAAGTKFLNSRRKQLPKETSIGFSNARSKQQTNKLGRSVVKDETITNRCGKPEDKPATSSRRSRREAIIPMDTNTPLVARNAPYRVDSSHVP